MRIPSPIIRQPSVPPGLRPLRIIKHRLIHRINLILIYAVRRCDVIGFCVLGFALPVFQLGGKGIKPLIALVP